jgi:hypothetical protein
MSDANIINYLVYRPLSIALCANDFVKFTNTSSVLTCATGNSQSTSLLNHAVLLTGYSSTAWYIKNSWGTSYGKYGYLLITRTTSANCGIGYYITTLSTTNGLVRPTTAS